VAKFKQTLVTLGKCSHCKLKDGFCAGLLAVEGSVLIICPCFMDRRSKKEPRGNEEVPFPIKRKRKGRKT